MNLTGSIGSWVPPAVTRKRLPAKSFGFSKARAVATISSGSGNLPIPESEPVNRPEAGGKTLYPRDESVAIFC